MPLQFRKSSRDSFPEHFRGFVQKFLQHVFRTVSEECSRYTSTNPFRNSSEGSFKNLSKFQKFVKTKQQLSIVSSKNFSKDFFGKAFSNFLRNSFGDFSGKYFTNFFKNACDGYCIKLEKKSPMFPLQHLSKIPSEIALEISWKTPLKIYCKDYFGKS